MSRRLSSPVPNSKHVSGFSRKIKEAGGKVSDWNGLPMPFYGNRVLATNAYIHGEMLKVIRKEYF